MFDVFKCHKSSSAQAGRVCVLPTWEIKTNPFLHRFSCRRAEAESRRTRRLSVSSSERLPPLSSFFDFLCLSLALCGVLLSKPIVVSFVVVVFAVFVKRRTAYCCQRGSLQ